MKEHKGVVLCGLKTIWGCPIIWKLRFRYEANAVSALPTPKLERIVYSCWDVCWRYVACGSHSQDSNEQPTYQYLYTRYKLRGGFQSGSFLRSTFDKILQGPPHMVGDRNETANEAEQPLSIVNCRHKRPPSFCVGQIVKPSHAIT